MRLTRKDFEAFAEALRDSRPQPWVRDERSRASEDQWEHDVRAVANVLYTSNGAFDRERFYRAAGVER